MEAELHLEAVGNRAELLFKALRRVGQRARESSPQVQRLAEAVVELLVLFDVEAAFKQEGGDCLHDPGAFDARQCEYELLCLLFFEQFGLG
ncbi:hypothetical protein D9M72_647230 [compost metagenome]